MKFLDLFTYTSQCCYAGFNSRRLHSIAQISKLQKARQAGLAGHSEVLHSAEAMAMVEGGVAKSTMPMIDQTLLRRTSIQTSFRLRMRSAEAHRLGLREDRITIHLLRTLPGIMDTTKALINQIHIIRTIAILRHNHMATDHRMGAITINGMVHRKNRHTRTDTGIPNAFRGHQMGGTMAMATETGDCLVKRGVDLVQGSSRSGDSASTHAVNIFASE